MGVEYKLQQEKEFSTILSKKRASLEQKDLDAETKKSLAADIERLSKERVMLHQMWTWPFGKVQGFQYGLVFLGNIFVSFESVLVNIPQATKIIEKVFPTSP